MRILNKDEEYIECSCGAKFTITDKDVIINVDGLEFIKHFECPICKTPHFVIKDVSGSEIISVEKEVPNGSNE